MRTHHFLARPLYGLYRALFIRLRSSRHLHRAMFGHLPQEPFGGPYWDYTTLDLWRALPRTLARGGAFLDMGTGPFAVLAVYAATRLRAGRVVAVDQRPDIVESARRHLAVAGADAEVIESDLFSAVTGEFDVIAFNTPCVASRAGERLGVFRSADEQERWGGGPDGMRIVAPFLAQAREHLAQGGSILLGTSHVFVDPVELRRRIDESGFEIERTFRFPLGLSQVYTLVRPGSRPT